MKKEPGTAAASACGRILHHLTRGGGSSSLQTHKAATKKAAAKHTREDSRNTTRRAVLATPDVALDWVLAAPDLMLAWAKDCSKNHCGNVLPMLVPPERPTHQNRLARVPAHRLPPR